MKLVENAQIAAGFVPVDMQAGANNGDWINLRDWNHLTVVVYKAAGTAGDDPVITLKQATDSSGTGAKALDFTELWKKQGTLTAAAQGTFTKVTQSAANTFTDTDSAENQGIYVLEIDGDMLDVDNAFVYVQISIPDVGNNAQLGCALYILTEPRYAQATPPSAL
jgi:hypothetical protein